MTGILRDLELLVTSRYHASVLSLAAHVPQIAIGHDTRLVRLFEELGLKDDYYFDGDSANIWDSVTEKVDTLLAEPDLQKEKLESGYKIQLSRAKRNRDVLRGFLTDHGWD
jgi:polysaccharide pyruvyl transferase WcaK-like protein